MFFIAQLRNKAFYINYRKIFNILFSFFDKRINHVVRKFIYNLFFNNVNKNK